MIARPTNVKGTGEPEGAETICVVTLRGPRKLVAEAIRDAMREGVLATLRTGRKPPAWVDFADARFSR